MSSPALRAVGLTAALACVWQFSSSGIVDAALWGAFLWAVVCRRPALKVWTGRPGALFILLAAWTAAGVAFSTAPRDSARDLLRSAEIFAAAFALPALAGTPARVGAGLAASAAALTLILAADLVRLAVRLGPALLSKAHDAEPFALGHSPNVGAMAAGAAALVLGAAAWGTRDRRARLACAAGAAANVAYLVVIASRGAQVALAAALAAAAVLGPRRWRWPARAAAALAVLAAAAGLGLAVNARFRDKVSMAGLSDRDRVWAHTWALSRARPVLGYGYGHTVFREVYHASDPPRARFHFQHPHSYWLSVLFAQGWAGVGLHLLAWGALAAALVRAAATGPPEACWVPLCLALLLAFIHVFGLADFPGSIVRMMLVWAVPCGLVAVAAVNGRRG